MALIAPHRSNRTYGAQDGACCDLQETLDRRAQHRVLGNFRRLVVRYDTLVTIYRRSSISLPHDRLTEGFEMTLVPLNMRELNMVLAKGDTWGRMSPRVGGSIPLSSLPWSSVWCRNPLRWFAASIIVGLILMIFALWETKLPKIEIKFATGVANSNQLNTAGFLIESLCFAISGHSQNENVFRA